MGSSLRRAGAHDPRDVGCRVAAREADDRCRGPTPSSNGCATGTGAACHGAGASRNVMPPHSSSICWRRSAARISSARSAPCRQELSGRSLGEPEPSGPHQRELPTRLASAAVFLLAWQIAADLAHSRLLPTVTSVLDAMVQQTISGALPWNLAITLGSGRRRLRAVAVAGQRARHRHGALATARSVARQCGDGAAEPAGARADRADLRLVRPERDRRRSRPSR